VLKSEIVLANCVQVWLDLSNTLASVDHHKASELSTIQLKY